MAVITKEIAWGDYNTEGVPGSGIKEPKKTEQRQYLGILETMAASGAVMVATKAELDAITDKADNAPGWVVGDSTGSNNGIYAWDDGGSTWTKLRGLPDTAAVLTNIGGTANAITADTETGIDPAEVQIIILPDPPGTNTSTTVTIAIDGGSAENIKSASGANVAIGDIIDGVGTMFFRSGSEWRQLVSSAEGAQFDHQGAYDNGTTYTEGQIVTGSDDKWYQLKVASATGDNPVSGGSGDWLEILDVSSIATPDASAINFRRDTDAEFQSVADQVTRFLTPEEWGAVGDAVKLTDAAITASGTTLTSASASWSASDIGKAVSLVGAGAAGIPLVTTIASINSSTSVETTDAASTTVSGAICVYGTDDAPAWREMLSKAVSLGIGAIIGKPGAKYLFASADSNDADSAHGLYVDSLAQDLAFFMHSTTIFATDAVDTDGADGDAGAIIRFVNATAGGTQSGNLIQWVGGRWDMANLRQASAGVTTVGGIAIEGAWSVAFRDIVFDHGTTTASGSSIGVGGGDQSIFLTGVWSGVVENCTFIGAPDLGIYVSSSSCQHLKIINNDFRRCLNCIDFKRSSGDSIVANNTALECGRFLGTPTADGSTSNHGRFLTVTGNRLYKIQTQPIDINAPCDRTLVFGNVIQDYGRHISDGTTRTDTGSQKYGIRVRAHGCQVFGNWIGFVDWTADSTAGEQSMGVVLAYDGNLTKGAEDCLVHTNVFVGTYRGIYSGSNTADNYFFGNRRIGVTAGDDDDGTNFHGIPVGGEIDNDTYWGASTGGGALEAWVQGSRPFYTSTTEFFAPVIRDNTSAGAANTRTDPTTGELYLSTSAAKYKDDIKIITPEMVDTFLSLRGVTYKSKCAKDDPETRFIGIIADEAHEVGLTELVSYRDGKVDGFQYERTTALLLEAVKQLRAEIDELKRSA